MSDQASAKSHEMPKHGEICWTEIATTDLEKADTFYSELFGWNIKSDNNPEFEYRHFSDGRGHDVGGMYQMNPEMFGGHAVPPHFMTYISVDDVDKTAKQVTDLGGRIVREPMDIPNTGRMAVLTDPAGATFAIITLTEHK